MNCRGWDGSTFLGDDERALRGVATTMREATEDVRGKAEGGRSGELRADS
jgi:hypothetical protein